MNPNLVSVAGYSHVSGCRCMDALKSLESYNSLGSLKNFIIEIFQFDSQDTLFQTFPFSQANTTDQLPGWYLICATL